MNENDEMQTEMADRIRHRRQIEQTYRDQIQAYKDENAKAMEMTKETLQLMRLSVYVLQRILDELQKP